MKRIFGATLFVAAVIGVMFLREVSLLSFDIIVILLTILGAYEISHALKEKLSLGNHIATAVFIGAILPTFYFLGGMNSIYKLFFVYFWAVAIMSIYHKGNSLENMASAMFVGIYPVMMFSFLVAINHWGVNGLVALMLIFAVGPFCDTGAFIVGSTVKGKKLCPTISPNKTISGAIGGVIGGILGAITVYLIARYALSIDVNAMGGILFFILFGIIGSVLTEFGDLVESAIKRSLEIKDMGNVIPGHGGILDRFDGVLFVVFGTYLYFIIAII